MKRPAIQSQTNVDANLELEEQSVTGANRVTGACPKFNMGVMDANVSKMKILK